MVQTFVVVDVVDVLEHFIQSKVMQGSPVQLGSPKWSRTSSSVVSGKYEAKLRPSQLLTHLLIQLPPR